MKGVFLIYNPAKGMIFEGIPATGKSTIIREILKNPKILNRDFMPFFTFGEEITQRVLEAKHNQGKITKEDNLKLLDDILAPLENYQSYYKKRGWVKEDKYHYGFILERFHLTHGIYFNHLGWQEMIKIDERLLKLNAKLCFLKMEKEVMKERIIDSRGKQWNNYISRFGNSTQEIIEYYYQQQEKKLRLVEKSKLTSIVVDTSNKNWSELATEIIEFWGI